MIQSRFFIPTTKMVITDDVVCKSLSLMLKAGMIKQVAAGIYSYLPLANIILDKIAQITREEMNNINSYELKMPILQPQEIWEKTGRWQKYGPELMRLKDRHERGFCLQPTSEEIITLIIKDHVKSWRSLPLSLFQVQTKFRDEARPRFGLMRGREFIMKDAYSFHSNTDDLDKHYREMEKAYENIFKRCGLKTIKVNADNGAIGGSESIEFMSISEIGEDTLVYCNKCNYQANLETAVAKYDVFNKGNEKIEDLTLLDTPNMTSIADLANYFKINPHRTAKYITYIDDANDNYYLVVIPGNYDINETKLLNLVNAQTLRLLTDEEIAEQGLVKGYIGAVNFEAKNDFIIVADDVIVNLLNHTAGANELDKHYIYVNYGRDYQADFVGDIKEVHENDKCPICKNKLSFDKGIEVGQIFKLGTVYTEALHCTYLDQNQKEQFMHMGCYGIGISRILMAIMENRASDDNKSIIFPKELQPFDVHLLVVDTKKEEQLKLANDLYNSLKLNGIDVLFDDRHERIGSKFADSDLIGINIRIIVGKKANDNMVELVKRDSNEKIEINSNEIITYLKDLFK
ncbi:MAG: proline--tRNA ligase [Bacilli bacterium]|jgi:prolyl-tRNA synthetase|nr:proline--tRNA ligase [Bacilli bacterium]